MYNKKELFKLKQIDDISLLELLCETDDDNVYKEFVNRFYDDVFEQCLIKCKSRNVDSHIGQQIAHETFERVRKYKSFDKSKLNLKNQKKSILGWLYRILVRLFYNYHNSLKSGELQINSYFDDLANVAMDIDIEDLAFKRDLANIIYNKLNKKEKEVVLTDLEYKRGQKYLPEDVSESLAEKLGVKKATIRKIRQRAVNKIKLALDEINK